MSQAKRIGIITAVLTAAVTLWGFAAPPAEQTETLKRDMVQSALGGLQPAPAALVLEGAIERAKALLGVKFDSTGAEPSLSLRLDGISPYDVQEFPESSSIIIDLYDTIVLPKADHVVIDANDSIQSLKAYLLAVEPQFITRIELVTRRTRTAKVSRGPSGLDIALPEVSDDAALRQAERIDYMLDRQMRSVEIGAAALKERILRSADASGPIKDEFGAALRTALESLRRAKVAAIAAQLLSISEASSATADRTTVDGVVTDVEILEGRIQSIAAAYQDAIGLLQSERALVSVELAELSELVAMRVQRARASERAAEPDRLIESLTRIGTEEANRIRALLGSLADAQNEFSRIARSLSSAMLKTEESLALTESKLSEMTGRDLSRPESSTPDRLALLDAQMGDLRRAAKQPALDETTARINELDSAIAGVDETPVDVDQVNLPTFAVIDASSIGAAGEPPSKREAPAKQSLTALASPEPSVGKMEMLAASPGALRDAQEKGIIVLAQAQVNEAEDAQEPQPASRTPASIDIGAVTRAAVPGQGIRPTVLYNPNLPPEEDPLMQPVNIDFKDMELSNVVSLLAETAQINVIAGTEVSGTVTANLENIPLGRAIEIVLRMNGLGVIEEDGVYRITSYEDAVASRRETRLIPLKSAAAAEVKQTLADVLSGTPEGGLMSVSANEATNVIILSGPNDLVRQMETVVSTLDVAEPVIPTVTVPIKLNYFEPGELINIIQPLLSESGKVSPDLRGRHIILTDLPVKVEEIRSLIETIDLPVKQVSIEAMIVDVLIADNGDTGVDWVLNLVRRQNRRGETIGDLESGSAQSDFTTGAVSPGASNPINLGGQLAFQILTGDINLRAAIAGEVRSENAELLANPVIVTVENQPARISIAEEIPFQELTQTTTGPPIATTEFKEVGTVLEVTPRVTHDNHIIVTIDAKQSDTKGESVTGVPPEDKREAQTTLRLKDGQTVFIGGLKRFDDEVSVRKTPLLGDIPIVNLLFRNNQIVKERLELFIFLTTHVLAEDIPDLSPEQKKRYDELGGVPTTPNATRDLYRTTIHPGEQREPFYKWRRAK